MTQRELDRAVSAVTGEKLATITRMGFGIADPAEVSFDPEPESRPPLVVDWDQVQAERYARCV